MQDALRAYMELALGVTEASRRKAEQVVKKLVGQGEARVAQVQGAVEELLATSRANREGIAKLVRYEVERAMTAVGLATADEVADLRDRVRELEQQLRQASAKAAAAEATAVDAAAAADSGPPAAGEAPAAQGPAVAVEPPAPVKKAVKKVVKKQVAKKAVRPAKKAPPPTAPEES